MTPEQVVAADGTSMANFLAMAALIAPGDEVLIEHADLRAAARRRELPRRRRSSGSNATPSKASASTSTRWPPRSASARASSSSPISTTRAARSTEEDDLRAVGELARRSSARILVDEVYLDSAVPPRRSAVHFGPEFVCTNSLTKVYGLSGLRCGWILAEPALAERMWRLNDLFGVNQAHQAERLACIALDRLDVVLGDTPAMLQRNRELFNRFASARDDLACMPAEHGIVAFPRWTGGDTTTLDALLRERYDTAVVPASGLKCPTISASA